MGSMVDLLQQRLDRGVGRGGNALGKNKGSSDLVLLEKLIL